MMTRWLALFFIFKISLLVQVDADADWLLLERLRQYWKCAALQAMAEDYEGRVRCPISFDGWLCWPSLDTGQEHELPCPSRDHAPSSASVARRFCYPNGSWDGATVAPFGQHRAERLSSPCPGPQQQEGRFWTALEGTRELWPPPYHGLKGADEVYEDCVLRVLAPWQQEDGFRYEPVLAVGDSSQSSPHRGYCPRTFDGWSCWNDTKAGDVARAPCPTFVPGFDRNRRGHKRCTAEGVWYLHPENNKTWSNYTTCVDQEDLLFRHRINSLYIAGYSLSLTALVVSLVVFFTFNSLKCGRVTIHKNLFVSFIMNNVLWIAWYIAIVPEPDVVKANQLPCQVLHVLLHYFLVSSYFWMFCEGFYLHTLLVLTFVAEVKVMRAIYLIGWGTPFFLVLAYALVRTHSSAEATMFCWIEDHWSIYILVVPVCLSLLLNLGFLVNIVRVLVTKLRAVNSPDSHRTRYRKAARATLILIPLLGLHYVITPFRPEQGSPGEAVYEVTAAVVASLQGFCVSLLFCFFNGEVIALVRKKWTQEILMRQKDRRTSYAATTISFSARHSPSEEVKHLHQKLMSEV